VLALSEMDGTLPTVVALSVRSLLYLILTLTASIGPKSMKNEMGVQEQWRLRPSEAKLLH